MKNLINIFLFMLATYSAFGSETVIEIYKGSASFAGGSMMRSFVLTDRVAVKDELHGSMLRGIAELEIIGKVEVLKSSRPWIGEPLYLVVLENNKQVGRIIQIYSEYGNGEFSIFEGTRNDNKTLSINFSVHQKFNSKTFERLLHNMIIQTIRRVSPVI